MPAEQTALPLGGRGHAVSQLPQWAISVLKSTQAPAHSCFPWLQTISHVNAEQTEIPPAGALMHIVPQEPQFWMSWLMSTSQPSAADMLQSTKPLLQEPTLQIPDEQARVPLAMGAQLAPHPPQLSGSAAVATSQPSLRLSPLQSFQPVLQGLVQTPAVQVVDATPVVEQADPQLPQCVGSSDVSISQPFAGAPSQSANVPAHVQV